MDPAEVEDVIVGAASQIGEQGGSSIGCDSF